MNTKIHDSSFVHKEAIIDENVCVGPFSVIGPNVKIGKNCIIHSHVVIDAGTHPVSSIKIAEASKAIENAQRDLNISFVNELAIIFDKMDIDTTEVLNAAGTKWNFLNFKPGLVGGHCIGIDPYYLFHAAKKIGYDPKTLLAGRNVNEFFPKFLAKKFLSYFKKKKNLKYF